MHLVIRHVNDRGGIHGRRLEVRSYPRAGGAGSSGQWSVVGVSRGLKHLKIA